MFYDIVFFRYYCFDCHDGEQYYVPAKVIKQWQFKKFKGTYTHSSYYNNYADSCLIFI